MTSQLLVFRKKNVSNNNNKYDDVINDHHSIDNPLNKLYCLAFLFHDKTLYESQKRTQSENSHWYSASL